MNKRKITLLMIILLAACSSLSTGCTNTTPNTELSNSTAEATLDVSTQRPTQISVQNLPFPRLVNWWPDPYTQSLSDIAKFDFVILFSQQTEFIEPLRQQNPDIIVIASTNVSEVPNDPENDVFDPRIKDYPPQWFLTLVGTTLREDVDIKQTILPVEELTITDGINSINLFEPGDDALIDGETVHIEEIDYGNRSLIVQRGGVRPASAHASGTRAATHVTLYPGAWAIDNSLTTPLGTIDPTVGPETWASYRARKDAQIVAGAAWDGIFVDRTSPNLQYPRPIDPDQSNRLLTDYTAYNAAWNEGLRSYLQELRDRIGPDKIIQLNYGINDYSVANGTNYECFPNDNAEGWHSSVIGPGLYDTGSYFEWIANAREPKMALIWTSASDCRDFDVKLDYRKMRFGLTTTLLNDGFFGFANGIWYGPDGLKWFAEYDNAGTALGYLGSALGPAELIELGSFTPEILLDSKFDTNGELEKWRIDQAQGYEASYTLDTLNPAEGIASLQIRVTQAMGEDYKASLTAAPVSVTENTNYTVRFKARADHAMPIHVWIQPTHAPWGDLAYFNQVMLSTEWQEYTFTDISIGTLPDAGLRFAAGKTTGTFWLDEVTLQTTRPDVYRRDFQNGIVLVNASIGPVTIPLGGIYQKINSIQARAVNDGSLVTEVTLQSLDGIILLRP